MTDIKLNDLEHARILGAYLTRLPDNDLANILRLAKKCSQAQANLGNNAQARAQEEMRQAILDSVVGLLQHDKGIIENVIKWATA